jgi:hypothetical protein
VRLKPHASTERQNVRWIYSRLKSHASTERSLVLAGWRVWDAFGVRSITSQTYRWSVKGRGPGLKPFLWLALFVGLKPHASTERPSVRWIYSRQKSHASTERSPVLVGWWVWDVFGVRSITSQTYRLSVKERARG